MKNFIITFSFLLFHLNAQAQDISLKEVFKSDNVSQLQSYLQDHDVNDCHTIMNADYTFLSLAIKSDATNIFYYLLDNGADVSKICTDKTPLMYAIKYNKKEMLEKLLRSGVKVDQISKSGKTSEDYCMKYDRPILLKLIRESLY